MSGVRSLQRTLALTVIAVVGFAIAALSATVYGLTSRSSHDRFDERIADQARGAALLVGRDGGLDPELNAELLTTIDQSRGATSFQIWREDGGVIVRYPPLASGLPRPLEGAPPRFETIPLPQGGTGRLFRAWFGLGPKAGAPSRGERVGISVLRDTDHLERRLSRLRALLLTADLVTMLLSGLVAWLVVRRSIRSVARLSARIGSIDAFSLGERLDVAGLPEELRPPFEKVNALLSRIEQVLNRERQFSADVSHELRTPLSGLRAILEVSGSRERTAAQHQASLRDSLEVVGQLEAIVENLLALARLGAGRPIEDQREEVEIAGLVNACFAPLREVAQRRRLRFDHWVAPTATLVADRLKLRLIITNLLSNAVQYTADGGWITVESEPFHGVILRVRDSGPAIPESALARIFDPFFRVDRSRSGGGEHFGIGLTLVRGLCESCGYRVTAENEPGGAVAFTITAQPGQHAPAQEPDTHPPAPDEAGPRGAIPGGVVSGPRSST